MVGVLTDEAILAAVQDSTPEVQSRVNVGLGDGRQWSYFDQVRRLCESDGWPLDLSVQFAAGCLPSSRRKWPPKPAYRSARIFRKTGDKERAIQEVRDWMTDWFYSYYKLEKPNAND